MEKRYQGAIHIRFPFQSMDDVSVSGAAAEQASDLMSTLKDHLRRNPSDDETYDSGGAESNDGSLEAIVAQMRASGARK